MELFEALRVELTLGAGLVGGILVGFMLRSLWPKKAPKKVRGKSGKSRKKSDKGETLADGKWNSYQDKKDGVEEFKDVDLYGEDEAGPDVYKDWQ